MTATTARSIYGIDAEALYEFGHQIQAAYETQSAAFSASLDAWHDDHSLAIDAGKIADHLDVKLRKGSTSGRYEIEVNGVHVGWVIRPSEWDTDRKSWRVFASQVRDFTGKVRAYGRTRTEAIDEFLSTIAIYGVTHTFGTPR